MRRERVVNGTWWRRGAITIVGVLAIIATGLTFAVTDVANAAVSPGGELSAERALPSSHDDASDSATVALPAGSSFVGWFGLPTTSTSILAGNSDIEALWSFDAITKTWTSDSSSLPPGLRTSLAISRGDALFVVTTAATDLTVPLSSVSTAPLGIFMDGPGSISPNQGDPAGGQTTLTRTPAGVAIDIAATNLDAGSAYSIWWVVFNNPAACTDDECGLDDVLAVLDPGVNPAEITLMNAAGKIAGASGEATFAGRLLLGDTGDHEVLFGDGLTTIMDAEIHVIIRTHGPASDDPDVLARQLGTFGESCTPESSFDIGAGDFGCFDQQDAIHLAPGA